ncbi:hypothetical protein AAEO56_01110 [Flavobacterium sp. DGU11]|uniref:Uncharacterized protein n=1 Tax=Flavobacterium arundinis TaxID=3139143 RepID=A0ABU9HSQ8_9FLAO
MNTFFYTKKAFSEKEILFILNLCDELLPPPKTAVITQANNVKELPITSYLDKEVLKAFVRNKYGIGYESDEGKPSIRITKPDGRGFVSIPSIKREEFHITKKIALHLAEGLDLKLLAVPPVEFESFNKIYKENRRTTDFPGLYWLQYYDAQEFKKQGGNAIFDNPYINAQLIKDGIFIEVGHSPYDFQTPEGEALMIKANAAMPPVVNY